MVGTSGQAASTMSDSDALLWTLSRDPVLRTTIVATFILDGAPAWDEVRSRLDALTWRVPRLRSRVVPRPGGWGRPRWVVDDRFDLDVHVRRMVAPPPATVRTVLDFAQVLATVGFDPALSPWEAVMVEGLEANKTALVVKFHHALSDGLGGMAVAALGLFDRTGEPRGDDTAASPGGARPVGQRPARSRPSGDVDAHPPVTTRRSGASKMASASHLLAGALRAAAHPAAQFAAARATAESVVRLLAPAPSPLSPLWRERGIGRRFEVIDLPLRALHAVAAETGTTLNDVFVTGILGGLRRYHDQHGAAVDHLRVLMPISVRGDRDAAMGNRFVPARFALVTGPDPAARLRHVHEVAGAWKRAPALGLNEVLAAALDALPAPLVIAIWGGMLKGTDFVATNVPGPPFDVALAGARVEQMYAFAPPSGAALNVALVTTSDRACVGVNIDTAAVPDGTMLVGCLEAGFDELLTLARSRREMVAS